MHPSHMQPTRRGIAEESGAMLYPHAKTAEGKPRLDSCRATAFHNCKQLCAPI
jgi:hypothetical protein